MAERRMFAKTIIDSDAFIDMPVTARLLYYDLSMRADDDGFVNSPKKIMRMIGASQDDLSVLIMKKFIIPFDSGIVVIKHWRIHNYIRKDTYNSTPYKDEIGSLELDENKAYRLKNEPRGRYVDEKSTQDRLGKDRLGKDRLGKDSVEGEPPPPPQDGNENEKEPVRHRHGEYHHVMLTDEQYDRLLSEYGEYYLSLYIRKVDEYCQQYGKTYKDYNLTLRKWMAKDNVQKLTRDDEQKQIWEV